MIHQKRKSKPLRTEVILLVTFPLDSCPFLRLSHTACGVKLKYTDIWMKCHIASLLVWFAIFEIIRHHFVKCGVLLKTLKCIEVTVKTVTFCLKNNRSVTFTSGPAKHCNWQEKGNPKAPFLSASKLVFILSSVSFNTFHFPDLVSGIKCVNLQQYMYMPQLLNYLSWKIDALNKYKSLMCTAEWEKEVEAQKKYSNVNHQWEVQSTRRS